MRFTEGRLCSSIRPIAYSAISPAKRHLSYRHYALSGANTYEGATRLTGGTVAFTQAYPGGDLEMPAAAQGGTSAPLLTAPSFAFAEGKGVRITEADTLDQQTFGPMKTLVVSTAPITSLPSLALVASDGSQFTDEKGIWRLFLLDGGRTLKFGPVRGTQILVR